jgi:hypothetical protein
LENTHPYPLLGDDWRKKMDFSKHCFETMPASLDEVRAVSHLGVYCLTASRNAGRHGSVKELWQAREFGEFYMNEIPSVSLDCERLIDVTEYLTIKGTRFEVLYTTAVTLQMDYFCLALVPVPGIFKAHQIEAVRHCIETADLVGLSDSYPCNPAKNWLHAFNASADAVTSSAVVQKKFTRHSSAKGYEWTYSRARPDLRMAKLAADIASMCGPMTALRMGKALC